jgi:hypothetical protein
VGSKLEEISTDQGGNARPLCTAEVGAPKRVA